jgi:isopentenyl-diphosphate delta-isomerase
MIAAKEVILVNEADEVVGTMEKMEAHRKGILHRAFSVFIFNTKGEMLLQQRAQNKYHSAGLWTNACCSHPAPGEPTQEAAERRLQEEMGFITPLQKVFEFTYKTEFENGLTEYEFDHVFAGTWDGIIAPQKDEVNDYCFKTLDEIQSSLLSHPQKYTAWFPLAFTRIEQWAKENILLKSPLFS